MTILMPTVSVYCAGFNYKNKETPAKDVEQRASCSYNSGSSTSFPPKLKIHGVAYESTEPECFEVHMYESDL